MAVKRLTNEKQKDKLKARKGLWQKFDQQINGINDPQAKKAIRILGKILRGQSDDEQ